MACHCRNVSLQAVDFGNALVSLFLQTFLCCINHERFHVFFSQRLIHAFGILPNILTRVSNVGNVLQNCSRLLG